MLRLASRAFGKRAFSSKVGVFGSVTNGSVDPAVSNALTAARELSAGGEVSLFLVGADATAAAEAFTVDSTGDLKTFVASSSDGLTHGIAEASALAVKQFITSEGLTHVVTASNAFGKNVLPRLGAQLDVQPVTDVVEIVSADTYKRPIYAGNAIATVASADAIKLLSVRTTNFEAVVGDASLSDVTEFAVTETDNKTSFVSADVSVSDRPELTAAPVVISGGRGVGSEDGFKILEDLADVLPNSALGASRAAVDAGYCPNDWQVGQTGKVVAPDLYIAVGISGAIQHLAGMKDSKVIVAVNKDPEAPIFALADYGIVGDLFTVVPELTEALKQEA